MNTSFLSRSLALVALTAICHVTPGAIFHVKTNGNDALSGATWELAKQTVAAGLAGATTNDEVWVAAGRYLERITMPSGADLYGGFDGTETSKQQRDWTNNLSILDGEYAGAVVVINGGGPETRIDGMVVTAGLAIHGGGIKMTGSGAVVAHCRITGNITDGAGAGMSIWGFLLLSSTEAYFPVVTNNIIVENQSINDEGDGGGIAVVGSSPFIANNLIARNTATRNGGGIACWRHSFPVIANNVIEANSASYDELTASTGGGGIFASATDLDGRPIPFSISSPRIVNNIVAVNGARHGGGIAVIDSTMGAANIKNNSVIANNGSGIYWANTSPTNDNNLVAYNTWGFEHNSAFHEPVVLRYNNVFGNNVLGAPSNYQTTPDVTGTDGNISADPLLANYQVGEFHLQPGSPCIDAGSTAIAFLDLPDMDGQPRVLGAAVDIGADESDGTSWSIPTPVIHVSKSGSDGDGISWATARTTVAGGIETAASQGGEVWVEGGVYFEHVQLPAFVHLYGGFAGGENQRDQRDAKTHPTVLDGAGTPRILYSRNAGYRVSGLDGFILQNGGQFTAGNPLHSELPYRTNTTLGGAIYCRVSAPVIANNVICTNSIGSPFTPALAHGAGIYAYLSHAIVTGNTFLQNENLNEFDGAGGGIYCRESFADIDRNTFTANHSRIGSAYYGTLSNVRFTHNTVESNSMYNTYPLPTYLGSQEGGVAMELMNDFLIEGNTIRGQIATAGAGLSLQSCDAGRVLNNVIVDNRAYDVTAGGGGMGGGINCFVNLNTTNLVLAHNTIVGNSAPINFGTEMGGGIAMTLIRSNLLILNNIVASNSSGIWRHPGSFYYPELRRNCVNNSNAVNYINLTASVNDLITDPQLVDRITGDFHLLASSPCIDAGGLGGVAASYDFDGIGRPLDGDNDGLAVVDIGAFEFIAPGTDTDGDGAPDAQEVIAGTNPADALSVLRLDSYIDTGTDHIVLTWPSVVDRVYDLSFIPTFDSAVNWQVLTGNVPGTGGLLQFDAPMVGTGNRFFRIEVTRTAGE